MRELEYRRRESPAQTLRPSVPMLDVRVALRSDLESEHTRTQTPAESGLRNASTPEGAERLDRRSDSQRKLRETSEEGRRSEVQTGELAVPQELKAMLIPPKIRD